MSDAVTVEESPAVEQVVQAEETIEQMVNRIPVFESKALRFSLSEGHQRIGATIFGRRGSVGISLKEVAKSKRYAVQVSPHHSYGNAFPLFPYFINCSKLSAVNFINRVALAIYDAD